MNKIILKYADLTVKDEDLKQRIKHKANKLGYNTGEVLVKYGGYIYFINFNEDVVTLQLEYK